MLDSALEHGIRIGFIAVFSLVLLWLARRLLPRAVTLGVARQRVEVDVSDSVALEEQGRRARTLSRVLVRTADVLVLAIAFFLVLGEVGFELGPLLAGAGVIGIAIGFGAQSLVRDVLAGLFVLLENQYAKGDVVRVAGVSGVVEDVNLRRTILRDIDGIVHTVPNGEIRLSSNLTRSWSRVNLNVSVSYDEDLDRARDVLDQVGAELAADPEWEPLVLEPPKVLRVEAFEESGVALKALGKTKPMKQWDVAGELRRRIKAAFDAEGIEIPRAQRVMLVQNVDGGEEEPHRPSRESRRRRPPA